MSCGVFPDLVWMDSTSSPCRLKSFIILLLPCVHTSVSFRHVTPYTPSSYPVSIAVMTRGTSISDRSGGEDSAPWGGML
uniref:Uncharacterized protein n=1 Tax=Magallana gigas TaxID=29159 RepID=K1Q0Y8_MAGGI